MIHFVVVAGLPAAVTRLAARLPVALEKTRIFEGERIERVGASRTWAAAAIAVPDPVCQTRLAADDDAMVVVNGPALSHGDGQTRLASDVLQAFRSGGSQAVSADLGGAYNFVGVAPSVGLRAFADFSGLFPIYWRAGSDFAVFSNRSTTIADVVGSEGWDLRALAWVIGHANLFGDQLPARDVSYLPPGREARVEWGDGHVRVDRSPVWVWPGSPEDRGRDDLTPGEWDEVTDALVANFRALRAVDGKLRLAISGGKDSRLCLALAKAADLGNRVETYTGGGVDSPEVEVGAAVARAAGFAHERTGPPAAVVGATPTPPKPRVPDPDAIWCRLRQDMYRYEAIVCAWSGLGNPHGRIVQIKGFGGELYRRGSASRFRDKQATTVEATAAMFVNYHQVHDPLGVLRPEEAGFQRDWLQAWVHSTAEKVRLDTLREKFLVDYVLGHWSGPLVQATPARIIVNPLLSPIAAKKCLELSADARSSERLHFEVMRRTAPELVVVPFLDDVWAEKIAANSPIDLPRDPYPTAVEPTKRALLQAHKGWPLLDSDGKAVTQLFKDAARHTDMASICDMKKLKRIARNSAQMKKMGAIKELFSAIGVALTLLDRTEPVLDRP
ncbi:MAG: hypothetical protein ACRDY6_15915 [Acidimicrobiia bacterium]